MAEQIEVLIVGAHDSKLLARLRESVEAQGHIVVNVGTVGHGFQGGMAIFIGVGNVNTVAPLLPERGISVSTRIGKGQRKANKANRWR